MAKRKKLVCPPLIKTLIIGNDAKLLAQFSSILAQKGSYLPIVDGPRLGRPDSSAEVITRNNLAARMKTKAIIYADLDKKSCKSFENHFSKEIIRAIQNIEQLKKASHGLPMRTGKKLEWGGDRIALGLLHALYAEAEIVFSDIPTTNDIVPSKSGHLVVCEEGDAIGQVIAANYAYSIGAGLCMIPTPPDETTDEILETFYSIQDDPEISASDLLMRLQEKMRQLAGAIPIDSHEAITFICKKMPWGFAFPEKPTTHLFIYPELGVAVANGLIAEQKGAPRVRVSTLIDPEQTRSQDIAIAVKCLRQRGSYVKMLGGYAATVHEITMLAELYPYDFLMISTHCSDVSGWRWTYEFTDSEKIKRTLVVDIGISVGTTPVSEKLNVIEFIWFVSLDGVDWHDPKKKEKLHIGTAITDWMELKKSKDLKPIIKEDINRVRGSAALKMADHNLMFMLQTLADNNTPIILNNACVSWHQLAERFSFAGCRAYLGTLVPVLPYEAEEITKALLDKHIGKPLAVALWHAQNKIYKDNVRRPYVLVGTHFQRLRITRTNAPKEILSRLMNTAIYWKKQFSSADPSNEFIIKSLEERVIYLEKEIKNIKDKWFSRKKKIK